MVKRRGLGRALSDMGVQEILSDIEATHDGTSVRNIPIEAVTTNANQPRKVFHSESIQELAESIKSYGIIQPLIVRETTPQQYEIVAGERRYRAATQAGITTLPVIIKTIDDQTADAIAIIENIQRENLNPMDEAEAYARLIDQYQMTHEDIASSLNKSRPAISNTLRLNKLHPEVKSCVREGQIEMGHARAILAAEYDKQPDLALKVVKQQLSVRQAEALLKPSTSTKKPPSETQWVAHALSRHAYQASIQGNATKGKLILQYSSEAQLRDMIQTLTLGKEENIEEHQ